MNIQITPNKRISFEQDELRLSKTSYHMGWNVGAFNNYDGEVFGSKWDSLLQSTDEMLFEVNSGRLARLRLRDEGKLATKLLPNNWWKTEIIRGSLIATEHDDFQLIFDGYLCESIKNNLLVKFTDLTYEQTSKNFRLQIAPDLYLLISNKRLCGWILENPVQYLWSDLHRASLDEEFVPDNGVLASLIDEFYQLARPENQERMYEEDIEILQQLRNLKEKLINAKQNHERAIAITKHIDLMVEEFYE